MLKKKAHLCTLSRLKKKRQKSISVTQPEVIGKGKDDKDVAYRGWLVTGKPNPSRINSTVLPMVNLGEESKIALNPLNSSWSVANGSDCGYTGPDTRCECA